MQLKVGDASIETEPSYGHEGHYDLWVRWEDSGTKYSLLIASDQAGFGVGYAAGRVQDLRRHVYEQGRIDMALGF